MGGSINGNLKFSKEHTNIPWQAEGKVGGTVNVEILGSVKLEGSVLWVKVAAGAYFKSASKETIDNKTEIAANFSAKTKEEDILIDGNLEFNGMTIYFASYLEVSRRGASNTHGSLSRGRHVNISAKREFRAEGKWELIDTWEGHHNFGRIENFIA